LTLWTKAEWKEWIRWYVEYYDALQVYLANASTLNVSMPSNSSENSTSGIFSSNSSSNESIVYLLNFTDIWNPIYDEAQFSVEEVVADLNGSSSVIVNTTSWFHVFFGPNGLVTLNTTLSMQQSSQSKNTSFGVNIPVGLEPMVTWVTTVNKVKINNIFETTCNFS
jgi:hypothetical protein